MKEVTYEDWQKNPTPREMWVWDDDEEDKKKLKVIYISKEPYPVIPVVSVTLDDKHVERYGHCAEINEPEVRRRRMTNKELSRWVREKTTREWKYNHVNYIYSFYIYTEGCADEEVCDRIVIREDDGEWREPLMEE